MYDPLSHALREVAPVNGHELERFVEAVVEVIDPGQGTIIWWIANWAKVCARYEGGESLVWRNAERFLGSSVSSPRDLD